MTIGEPFLSGLAGNLDRYVVVYLISRSHEVEGLALINWVARVRTADGQPMPPRTETTPRASMTYSRSVAERAAVVRWDCRWTTSWSIGKWSASKSRRAGRFLSSRPLGLGRISHR
jgi:hypothetical protein